MLYRSAVSEVTLAVRMSVSLLQLCFFLVIELFYIYCFLLCSFTSGVIIVVHANSFPPESWVRASVAQIANDKNSSAGPRLYIKC